jgi:hypothetical protein
MDSNGPRMPQDMVGCKDIGAWPAPDDSQIYDEVASMSQLFKVVECHNAKGYLHMSVPFDCLSWMEPNVLTSTFF